MPVEAGKRDQRLLTILFRRRLKKAKTEIRSSEKYLELDGSLEGMLGVWTYSIRTY